MKQNQEHVVELSRYKGLVQKLGTAPLLFLVLVLALVFEKGLVDGLISSLVILLFLAHFAAAYIATGCILKKEALSFPKALVLIFVAVGDAVLAYHGKYMLVLIFVFVPIAIVGFLVGKTFLKR